VFIRGFRAARRPLRIWPKHLKAAGGPSPGPEEDGCEPGVGLVSIPQTAKVESLLDFFRPSSKVSKYRDPLHQILDYICEVWPRKSFWVYAQVKYVADTLRHGTRS